VYIVKVNIRRLKPEDIGDVTRIQERIQRKSVSKRWRRMVKGFAERSGESCFVAEIKGKIAGFVLGEIKEYGFGMERTGWLEIVGVDPRHMGSGIGKKLGKKLVDHFRRRDCASVHTAVAWDSGDLLAFFKSLGFERSEFMNLERRIKKRSSKLKGGKR
jgi:ribosomal protein S18 acetylase RimI-like enzyme